MKIVAIIPARYASTRLPGKPLKDIAGKPMIKWVYSKVREVKNIDKVVVATDDKQIYDVCIKSDIEVMMTRNDHATAIHRLHEVAETIDSDIYLQVNGDEPLISTEILSKFVEVIRGTDLTGECGINAIAAMRNPVEVMDSANIKMVFNEAFDCCYMSRAAIPFPYKTLSYQYYKHIGIIGYTKEMLRFYVTTTPGYYEKVEGIDLLRFIDYGKKLRLVDVGECETLSVDTEKDLEFVRERMEKLVNGND